MGDLGLVTDTELKLPDRVVGKVKWSGGEKCKPISIGEDIDM